MASGHRNWRLYCLVPDPDTARAVADDLAQANIGTQNLRVASRRKTLVAGLPEAGVRERTAIVEAAKRGLVIGSLAGAITGLAAAIELPVNLVVACGLVVFGSVAGSAFGAWVSAMMGIDRPHREISQYQSAIDAGNVLIIIRVHGEQIERIEHLIRQRHPNAAISAATDGTTP